MDNNAFQQQDRSLDLPASTLLNNAEENRSHTYPALYHHSHSHPIWPTFSFPTLDEADMTHQQYLDPHVQHHQQQQQPSSSRPSSDSGRHSSTFQSDKVPVGYHGIDRVWQMQLNQALAAQQSQQHFPQIQPQQEQHFGEQYITQATSTVNAAVWAAYANALQTSPIDIAPTNAGTYSNPVITSQQDAAARTAAFNMMQAPGEPVNALAYPLNDYQLELANAFNISIQNAFGQQTAESVQTSLSTGSPTSTALELASLSDGEWTAVNFQPSRQSLDSITGTVSNPSLNLHIRTGSNSSSSESDSAQLSGSYEEIPPWPLGSPQDEFHSQNYIDSHFLQHGLPIPGIEQPQTSPSSSLAASPSSNTRATFQQVSSTSPSSSGSSSPPIRRRKAPATDKVSKVIIKKTVQHSVRKDTTAEKKVGKRRGPLRPEQRQQAHEIRKLRACLRCKFLKKTCDKGEPCGGCRPSHARLWQVPCTRLDIKDIAYFMKDWKADYERHVSLGFSVNNIKGFSNIERTLYITHGYGHYLPINAREIFVREDKCFDVNWVESIHETPREFEVNTAKLSAGIEGISLVQLSEYLDLHLDSGFESFVDEYFEGTVFLTEILKTVYNYYRKTKTPCIRKALKLVLAYNLTLHLTMVEGLSEEEQYIGRIEDPGSKFNGKTFAPVMINFQIKCALADMWRELQKDVLEELSSLYSSVYSGEKLKNWPTIFMLATILLAIWEEMQFDCHYRVPDEKAVHKFCEDMETTPVGVIVGLFQAISTKLPAIYEWDTRKHQYLLGNDMAICDALTEVKEHIHKYGEQHCGWTLDVRTDTGCRSLPSRSRCDSKV